MKTGTTDPSSETPAKREPENPSTGRSVAGGFLMGFANLVPGLSGGTMILAVGLYDRFIGALASVSRLRIRRPDVLFLGALGLGLVAAILFLAGPAVWLVTEHRWIAYSLFCGMTLGGVPSLMPALRSPAQPGGTGQPGRIGVNVWIGALVGIAVMAGLAFGLRNTSLPTTFPVLVAISAVAASSMILPGISGSYILLVFGMYDVVVGSLSVSSLRRDVGGSLEILVPVGIGIVLGIGVLSIVLKSLLARFPTSSHGVLLGLLLGSVLGLFPFQRAVHPDLASKQRIEAVVLILEGAEVAAIERDTGLELDAARADELRTRYAGNTKGELKLLGLEQVTYAPGVLDVLIALAVFASGFGLTRGVGRLGGSRA